jgi:hypothetical protein
MAMVAEIYIEWLSLAVVLMWWHLDHWVIARRELVTEAQPIYSVFVSCRGVLPTADTTRLSWGPRPRCTDTPAIFYAGGISRLTIEHDVLEAVTDALHRSSSASRVRRPLYIQENPASNVLEIIKKGLRKLH